MRLTIARFPKLTFKKWVELASNQQKVGGTNTTSVYPCHSHGIPHMHVHKYGNYAGLSCHLFIMFLLIG